MTITLRDLLGAALAAVLASSCSTSPPGAGFTNGDKATFTAEEKPAIRDDLHMPDSVEPGDARLAESAASSPAASGNDAGTGGRNGGQAGEPAAGATGEDSAPSRSNPRPSATPPRIESSGESGAQGGSRPPGEIKEGNPRSPQ